MPSYLNFCQITIFYNTILLNQNLIVMPKNLANELSVIILLHCDSKFI